MMLFYPILYTFTPFHPKSNRLFMNHLRCILLIILLPVLFISCGQPAKSPEIVSELFVIKDFNPATNWKRDQPLYLDYTEAKANGFIIPTIRQVEGGLFQVEFKIKNTGAAPQNFFFKIFYQNESYKFPERDPNDSTRQHPDAWENFYGSWEDVATTFIETGTIPADQDFHGIVGKFRIVGNPRSEQR